MTNTKISAMDSAASMGDSDLIPIVQSLLNKKITAESMRAYMSGGGAREFSITSFGAQGKGLDTTGATDGNALRAATAAAAAVATATSPAVVRIPAGKYVLNYDTGGSHFGGAGYKFCVSIPSNVFIRLDPGTYVTLAAGQQADGRIVDMFYGYDTENTGVIGALSPSCVVTMNTAGQTGWTGSGGGKYQSEVGGCPIRFGSSKATILNDVFIAGLTLKDCFGTPFDFFAGMAYANVTLWEGVYIRDVVTDLSCDGCIITAANNVFCTDIYHYSRAVDTTDAANLDTPSNQDGFELVGCTNVSLANINILGTFNGAGIDFFGSSNVSCVNVVMYRPLDIFQFGTPITTSNGGLGTYTDRVVIQGVTVKDCQGGGSALSMVGASNSIGDFVGTVRISDMIVDGCAVPFKISGDKNIHRNVPYGDFWLTNATFINCTQGALIEHAADRPWHLRNVQVVLKSTSVDQAALYISRSNASAKSTQYIDIDSCLFDANGRPDGIDIATASTSGLTCTGKISNTKVQNFTALPCQLTGTTPADIGLLSLTNNEPYVGTASSTVSPAPFWYTILEHDSRVNVNMNGFQTTKPGCFNQRLKIRLKRYSNVNSNYRWDLISAGRYKFLTAAGGDAGLGQPNDVYFNGIKLTPGTYASLAAGQWAWDVAGGAFSTIVVRLTGDVDPDTQGTDSIESTYNGNVRDRAFGGASNGMRLISGGSSFTLQGYDTIDFVYNNKTFNFMEQYRSIYT